MASNAAGKAVGRIGRVSRARPPSAQAVRALRDRCGR